MELGRLVQEYRKKNKVTQRELAERFGVTDIVIHRIESGKSFRLTPGVRDGLKSILSEEDIQQLDESNAAVIQLKYMKGDAAHDSRMMSTAVRNAGSYLKKLERIGYAVCDACKEVSGLSFFDYSVRNSTGQKWLIDFSGCARQEHLDSKFAVGRIWRACGAGVCRGPVHKISIVFQDDISEILAHNKDVLSPNDFPCDVSILYYNPSLKRIDKEVMLYQAESGKGFYNFNSLEQREQAQYEYIQWTFLLNQGEINQSLLK